MPELLELLERVWPGKLGLVVNILHTLPVANAVRGYEMFNKKQGECRKVVLVP